MSDFTVRKKQMADDKRRSSFPISVWYSEKTGLIHISRPTDDGFATTVSGDPNNARGHVHLYRKLAEALRESGAPAPKVDLRAER